MRRRGTNVQDGSVFHVSDSYATVVGEECVIGHRAVLHACTVKDGVLIGEAGVSAVTPVSCGSHCFLSWQYKLAQ